ncbi:epithelial membrane protein 2 isoform X3 [Heliangelus exortis]|uniref:epithelial membrane protein 2 isoform X3 n=1 Tax=Heliangelus exortis TaxID=472823 RepID=UPI003A9583F6
MAPGEGRAAALMDARPPRGETGGEKFLPCSPYPSLPPSPRTHARTHTLLCLRRRRRGTFENYFLSTPRSFLTSFLQEGGREAAAATAARRSQPAESVRPRSYASVKAERVHSCFVRKPKPQYTSSSFFQISAESSRVLLEYLNTLILNLLSLRLFFRIFRFISD